MTIAFPENATHLDFPVLSSQFLDSPWHPVSVLVLFAIDVGIAIALLKDFRMRDGLSAGSRLGFVFLFLLLFLLISIGLPSFNKDFVHLHPLMIAGAALFSIGFLRGLSYAPPQRARRLRRVSAAPAFEEDDGENEGAEAGGHP
ncbi:MULTISPECIES: hypothetical protein [unclassified Bradyrhizobium]|uniref:hypothetical protein n=1 Tax=unclassified Bradyrhizobium TaxID=2631580 RepID=UPI0028EC5F62|nr:MULTISPECIES: hypothetical protein [unclassified Bradyrhizobium]